MENERRALIVSIFFIDPETHDEFIHTVLLSAFVHMDLADRRVAEQLASAAIAYGTRSGRDLTRFYSRHVSVREIFASELAELLPMARQGTGSSTIDVPDSPENN